jgi:AraC-like DNA-binding protein
MKGSRTGPRVAPPLVRVASSSHDEYLSSFRHLRLRGFTLDRATRPWRVTSCRLASCVVEYGVDGAPWVARGSTSGGFATFAFPGSPEARLLVDGRELSEGELGLWPGGSRLSIVSRRPAELFVVSVAEVLRSSLAARDGGREAGAGVRRVRPEELAHVRGLASQVIEGAVIAGPAGPAPEDSKRLEQALLEELVRLTAGPGFPGGKGVRPSVLERIEEYLDAHPAEPVYVADLCAVTGLPERTLRYVLVEQYGESPMRLLRSRRLCQLRRALQADREAGESLARVAGRHGFRHMGTLAADYWNLFGELPSETRRAFGGSDRAALRPPGSLLSMPVSDSRA